jgi:hypothetical protein
MKKKAELATNIAPRSQPRLFAMMNVSKKKRIKGVGIENGHT